LNRWLWLALVVLASHARAEAERPQLPSWFPPPGAGYAMNAKGLVFRAYDEFNLAVDPKLLPGAKRNSGGYFPVHGKVWRFDLEKPSPGTWAAIIEPLQKQGFRFSKGDVKSAPASASLVKGEGDGALYVQFTQCCNSVAIVETGPDPFKLSMTPPAPQPERFGPKDDIPYARPIEGGRLADAKNDVHNNIFVDPKCNSKSEAFGTQYSWRRYEGPTGLSDYAIQQTYEDALRAAGWEQLCEGGSHTLAAHYTKDGRDIWLKLRPGVSEQRFNYEITVSDAGSGLRAELEKSCRVAIYGVNFDFDKATLRPDAEPALNQVLALMKEDAKLAVEVGGHTDNVGKPDYNARLSDERAVAVVQWLVQHGVAKARLGSHGYGDTQPLVQNSTDENRARNRRVELKRADCK